MLADLVDVYSLDVVDLRESRTDDESLLLVLRINHPSSQKCFYSNFDHLKSMNVSLLLDYIIHHADKDSNRDGSSIEQHGCWVTVSYSFSGKGVFEFVCAPLNFDIGLSYLKGDDHEEEIKYAMATLLDLSQDFANGSCQS
jgi:hypothetical protein